MSNLKIVEFPSNVRPACGLTNAPRFIHLVEPRVAIRLQRSREVAQVALGMLALAIGRVREPHPRRRGVPGRPVITNIDRKSTRLNSSHLVISYAVFCLK